MDLFMIMLFCCSLILGLIVLDYLLDSNLKDELNRVLGPRKRIKGIRKRSLNLLNKIDKEDYEYEKKKQQIDIQGDFLTGLPVLQKFQDNKEEKL